MGPYDTNQNSIAEGVVRVDSLYARVDGSGGVTHETEDVKLLRQPHMAHYRPPKRRKKDNPDIILCSAEDCKAFPMKETGYCAGHTRSMGLRPDWPKGGGRKPRSEREK